MNREQVFERARLKAAKLEAARKLEAFEKAHEGTSHPLYPLIFDRWLETKKRRRFTRFSASHPLYPLIFDRWLETVDALERFEQEMERVAS